MASPKICSIPGCDKKHDSKGMCSIHYQRWKRHGDPLYERGRRLCSIDGCHKPHCANGYCAAHNWRFKTHGDPLGGGPSPMRNQGHTCSVDGCDNPADTKQLCVSHYHRLLRYGDPLAGGTYHGEPWQWIEDHIDWDGDDCLIWPFTRNAKGYGYVTLRDTRKSISAARFVCEQAHGSAPSPDHEAAHNCGNGHLGCVNPKHLRWDTRAGNMADKVIHGTAPRGENCGSAKLTEEQVREIRRLMGIVPQTKLAERYGVTNSAISAIHVGRTWFWLDED